MEVLVPGPDGRLGKAHCARLDSGQLFDVAPRLARAVLPSLGATVPSGPAERPASLPAYLLYAEARSAVRMRAWGEAVRLLDSALEEDPQLAPALALRARIWAGWRPLGAEFCGRGPGRPRYPRRSRRSERACRATRGVRPMRAWTWAGR